MTPRAEALRRAPFTLVLSAGFFGFFAHTGFLLALEAARLRPRRIAGVSAGALAGGLWAAGVGAGELRDRLLTLRRESFWDPGLPLGGLLAGKRFGALLEEMAPGARLEALSTPFAPVVFDLLAVRTRALDSGALSTAVRASCAVPLLFRPVRIERRWYVDGGVRDRFGTTALASDERVVAHYLPSTSPWDRLLRRSGAHAGAAVLVANGLRRLGPYRMEGGAEVVEMARTAAAAWLGERVPAGGDRDAPTEERVSTR